MNRFLNNWELKLISLGLAVLLWTHVRGEVNPLETAEIEAPLRIQVPRGWQVVNTAKMPQRVTVTLSGPRLSLRDARGGTLANPLVATTSTRIRVVAADVRARDGEQEIALTGDTNLPDIKVLGVKPAAISIRLQRSK